MQVTHLRTKALTRLGSPAMKKNLHLGVHMWPASLCDPVHGIVQ